ncbi:MAG: small multi-drug export protein [Clostridiales bacterium]|nr:small multi-drug export protein [Clostridiales bacterium]
MQSLVNWFVNSPLGEHVSREVVVFIISLFPILELRGGILAASLLDVTMWKGILISAVGNFIPIPFILIFIKKIFAALRRTKLFRPLVEKLENRAMNRKGQIERYKFIGLLFFVGIPLPMTGAWTGSLVAALLDMDVKRAILAELCGICMAAVIMTIISYGIIGNIIR